MPSNLSLSMILNLIYCIKYKEKIKNIIPFLNAYYYLFGDTLDQLLMLPNTLKNYYIMILYNIYFFLFYHLLNNTHINNNY